IVRRAHAGDDGLPPEAGNGVVVAEVVDLHAGRRRLLPRIRQAGRAKARRAELLHALLRHVEGDAVVAFGMDEILGRAEHHCDADGGDAYDASSDESLDECEPTLSDGTPATQPGRARVGARKLYNAGKVLPHRSKPPFALGQIYVIYPRKALTDHSFLRHSRRLTRPRPSSKRSERPMTPA